MEKVCKFFHKQTQAVAVTKTPGRLRYDENVFLRNCHVVDDFDCFHTFESDLF